MIDIESAGATAIIPGGKPYALQPLNYGPYAAWTLDQPNGVEKVDRTGNGKTGGSNNFSYGQNVQSPIPGRIAFAMNGIQGQANGPISVANVPLSGFVTNGVSLCMWVMRMGRANNSYSECWSTGWWTDTAGVVMPWYYEDSLGGRIYTWGGANHANMNRQLRFALWDFVSVSIKPTAQGGEVIQGHNGVYVSTPAIGLNMPSSGNPTVFGIGAATYITTYGRQSCAAFFDVVLWQKPLTQAEMEAQRQSVLRG